MSSYAPIHVHSGYSILDGLSTIPDLVNRTAELELPALSITDHGSLSGAYKLWSLAGAAGIKPIIGCEFYIAPLSRSHKEPVRWGLPEQRADDVSGGGKYCHITVLAESDEGVGNLFRLYADSFTTGFYGKPRIDLDSLGEFAPGLIVLTGCVGGPVATFLRLGLEGRATSYLGDLKDIFGDRLYVEVMRHGIDVEARVEADLLRLSSSHRVPVVATLDSHYTNEQDGETHDALLCVQTKALLATPKSERFAFDGDGYFLQSSEQFRRRFEDLPRAVDATLEIADRVSYSAPFGPDSTPGGGRTSSARNRLPSFTGSTNGDSAEIIRRCSAEADSKGWGTSYTNRLAYELETICGRGFAGYLLVTAHCMKEGRDAGIRFGPGRGSSGGSLVCYALGITQLDPIHHGLLFERFINPERVSLPDVDVDVDRAKREEFIDIIRRLYGDDCVSQIVTHGTIGARAAIKDSVRILGLPYKVGNDLVAQLPPALFGRQPSLSELKADLGQTRVIRVATGLEGATRSESVHAAGVIVSPGPLADSIPVKRVQSGKSGLVSSLDMDDLDELGYAKTDVLGLANLGVIDECVRLLSRVLEEREQPGRVWLPTTFDDPATYRLFSAGETTGVFQMDSPGMRQLLRRVRPASFADISAVLALYRPGPMAANAHTQYADRKNGRVGVDYPHPEFESDLADCLRPTHGLIVFQEQVLQILTITGGYTYGTAALIFDAMRKKDREKLLSARPDFCQRLHDRGYTDDAITSLWDVLVPFSDYSFNLAHATGYGQISYWTAYLKMNHPREYFCALLTVELDPEKLHEYINEAVRWGINVLPPDVNQSGKGWTLTDDGILFGLTSIKGVAASGVAALTKHRPYVSIQDFFARADPKVLNLSVLHALVECGAFDSLTPNREGLLVQAESLAARAISDRDLAGKGASRLFSDYTLSPRTVDIASRRRQEEARLGISLSVGSVMLSGAALSGAELEYVRRVIQDHPGRQRVDITLGSVTLRGVGNIELSDGATASFGSIGLTVEEE